MLHEPSPALSGSELMPLCLDPTSLLPPSDQPRAPVSKSMVPPLAPKIRSRREAQRLLEEEIYLEEHEGVEEGEIAGLDLYFEGLEKASCLATSPE